MKPQLTKIYLDAECAVLGACKFSGGSGPSSGDCDLPFPACRQSSSWWLALRLHVNLSNMTTVGRASAPAASGWQGDRPYILWFRPLHKIPNLP